MQKNVVDKVINSKQDIYLSIDHLKPGNYILNILLDNKTVKSIKLKKK